MSALLIAEYWALCEKTWTIINNKLNSSEGITTVVEHSQANGRVLHHRHNTATLLHYGDHHRIEYPIGYIVMWGIKRKKGFLGILDAPHKQYTRDCTALSGGQHI